MHWIGLDPFFGYRKIYSTQRPTCVLLELKWQALRMKWLPSLSQVASAQDQNLHLWSSRVWIPFSHWFNCLIMHIWQTFDAFGQLSNKRAIETRAAYSSQQAVAAFIEKTFPFSERKFPPFSNIFLRTMWKWQYYPFENYKLCANCSSTVTCCSRIDQQEII